MIRPDPLRANGRSLCVDARTGPGGATTAGDLLWPRGPSSWRSPRNRGVYTSESRNPETGDGDANPAAGSGGEQVRPGAGGDGGGGVGPATGTGPAPAAVLGRPPAVPGGGL